MAYGIAPLAVRRGLVQEEFRHYDEVEQRLSQLVDIHKDPIAVERTYERCLVILDSYQEQPHLLDPHLESLLGQLLGIIRSETCLQEVMDLAFKFMYLITKTRGHKVVVRFMPHEVADLEPVLAMLSQQSGNSCNTWETRYMLLLWLSMVCMIPFDMIRLDSNMQSQTGEVRKPIMDRIIEVGKLYLAVSDKSRDAAAYMLSRFMTRPDVKKAKLPEFLDWALQQIHTFDKDTLTGQVKIMGILSSLALLFKQGKREDLVGYAPIVLEHVKKLCLADSSNHVLRKLGIKLVQRIALTFLRAKIASWRYTRGSRSLADNLTSGGGVVPSVTLDQKAPEPGGADEDYDIPDEMEEVIEQLLNGLRDSATIVRWSAAKGIGRVTGRLPEELADEVVGSLMELFTITETDAAWHGGCLALAELGRRGLLLPHRLPDVVPVVLKALAYDEKRGNFSVGSHVRDAACYVCWAFARAYEADDIKPYVNMIASALLILTIFDREVNVRKAAAAAFQENVGRQGQFPHGIDIVVTCDYFAVGNRIDCYLDLSVYLAQFEEYTHALIEHLYKVKLSHWDVAIREIAAEALSKLTSKAPEFVVEIVLPAVAAECTSIDLNHRHGAVLMAAHTTRALGYIADAQNRNVSELIGEQSTTILKHLTQKFHDAKLFRGGGGELMRIAVCCLIENLSLAKMPFHTDPVIGVWQNLIEECLLYKKPEIQYAAIQAIPAFCTCYYQQPDGQAIPEIQDQILTRYLRELESIVEPNRMGFALALGALPRFMLKGRLTEVMADLVNASQISPKYIKFAEARRDAVLALTSICTTVGIDMDGSPNDVICPSNIPVLYDAFFASMEDYTLDRRGDVGSWVREACMTGLQILTSMIVHHNPKLITADRIEKIFCCLIQQASEKIDRTRAHAGEVFKTLLYHKPEVPHIPHREQLIKIFPLENLSTMNLAVPAVTFPLFTQLLDMPTYAYHELLGLTVSAGGLTESLVRHSFNSLITWLQIHVKDLTSCEAFCALVLRMCSEFPRQDRVMLPMLKMLDQLLARGCFDALLDTSEPEFPKELLTVCRREAAKCGNPQKLLACIDVCCGLIQFPGDVRKKTLQQLLIFLCHKYPRVRKQCAQKLYEAIMMYDDVVDEDKLDDVMTALSDTEWNEEVANIRQIRNKLCDMLNIPQPKQKVTVPQ